MSTPTERLVARLRALDPDLLPPNVTAERTYAGWSQRANGAWSFELFDADTGYGLNIGSQWSMTRLLKERRLSVTRGYTEGTGYHIDFDTADVKPAQWRYYAQEPANA